MAVDMLSDPRLDLPRSPSGPKEQVVPDPLPPIRVLIADDDHRVRTALSALLTAATGFDIVGAAATAASALTMAREQLPTVALVDLLLPEASDGLGLLRTITDELHIPAIAISVDGGLRNSSLAAGAAGFVEKGNTAERLISALRAVAP
jgi:DNA-binding NarL/FixJ family response regulator